MDEPLIPAQLPDRETFQRVWNRVMPNQENCPVALTPAPQAPAAQPGNRDADLLARLLDQQAAEAAAYQQMARQQNPCGRRLSVLAADCQRSFRQLSAARFLLTGQPYRPGPAAVSLPSSLPLALRERYLEARRGHTMAEQASQQVQDPALARLLTEFARELEDRAGQIAAILEQIFPAPLPGSSRNSLRCN